MRKYALKYADKLPANPHSYGILGYSAKYIQIHTNITINIAPSSPLPINRQKKRAFLPVYLSPPLLNKSNK
jgi:hypothetical protein